MINKVVPIVGLLIFDTIAMSYITSFAKNTKITKFLVFALIFELVAWYFLVKMIQNGGLSVSNAIWDIGSLLFVTAVAMFQFKEKLHFRHCFGLLLGIFSISLLVDLEK